MLMDAHDGRQMLSAEPTIDPSASVRDCKLGTYTEVGARTILLDVAMADYSYVVNDAQITYTSIGKFCSIAAMTRINPGNHPMHRASQAHFTYRASAYFEGERRCRLFAGGAGITSHRLMSGSVTRGSCRPLVSTGACRGWRLVPREVPPIRLLQATRPADQRRFPSPLRAPCGACMVGLDTRRLPRLPDFAARCRGLSREVRIDRRSVVSHSTECRSVTERSSKVAGALAQDIRNHVAAAREIAALYRQ